MNKPIIGIVSKHYATYKSNKIDTFVRDEIKQAIFDNGAIAIGILSPNEEILYTGELREILKEEIRHFKIVNRC